MVWKCLHPRHPGTAQGDGNSTGAWEGLLHRQTASRRAGVQSGVPLTHSPVTAPTPGVCLILTRPQNAGSFGMDVVAQLLMSDSETPWTAAHQASLSFTNTQSLLKPMSIESVMPSNHLILCRPLLLLPSIFPSIRVFSKESVLRIR